MRPSCADKWKRFREFWWGDRGLSSLLLFLLLIFFLSPFLGSLAEFLISVFFALLLISGTANITERKIFRWIAATVAGSTILFNILQEIRPGPLMNCLWQLSGVIYLFLLIYVVLLQVFRDGPVTSHRVQGAIAVYLLIGITWTFIYELIDQCIPGAFSFPQSMKDLPGGPDHRSSMTYFSFVTMTTLGYGDILPVSPVARVFVITEALIGQLYPATLLARLVSLEISHKQGQGGPAAQEEKE